MSSRYSPKLTSLLAHHSNASLIGFELDIDKLITIDIEGIITIFEMKNLVPKSEPLIKIETLNKIYSYCYIKSTGILLMGCMGGELCVVDMKRNASSKKFYLVKCHLLDVTQILWIQEKDIVITMGLDPLIKVWRPDMKKPIKQFDTKVVYSKCNIALGMRNQLLFVSYFQRKFEAFCMQSGQKKVSYSIKGVKCLLTKKMLFNEEQGLMISDSGSLSFQCWKLDSKKGLRLIKCINLTDLPILEGAEIRDYLLCKGLLYVLGSTGALVEWDILGVKGRVVEMIPQGKSMFLRYEETISSLIMCSDSIFSLFRLG